MTEKKERMVRLSNELIKLKAQRANQYLWQLDLGVSMKAAEFDLAMEYKGTKEELEKLKNLNEVS